jgi:hypothetical protein
VLAGERHASAGEKALDDRQCLRHALDPEARRVERDPCLFVIRRQPACPQPEVEPTIGEEIERRRLLGEHHRVAVVVVEHERADAKGGGRIRGRHEGCDRPELIAEVVWEAQRRISD